MDHQAALISFTMGLAAVLSVIFSMALLPVTAIPLYIIGIFVSPFLGLLALVLGSVAARRNHLIKNRKGVVYSLLGTVSGALVLGSYIFFVVLAFRLAG